MDVQGFFIISLLGLLDLTPGMSIVYKDTSFEPKIMVHNRTVSCSGETSGKQYNAPMYSCHNIRIDGSPLFHGYNDFSDEPDSLRDFKNDLNNNGCPECPCGRYVNEPTDVYALCAALLQASDIKPALHTAYVPDPICTQKGPEERAKFYLDNNKPNWLIVRTNNGYVGTLQCLTSTS